MLALMLVDEYKQTATAVPPPLQVLRRLYDTRPASLQTIGKGERGEEVSIYDKNLGCVNLHAEGLLESRKTLET